jgi:ABC-type proline/glycine betaine transport system permease subunit
MFAGAVLVAALAIVLDVLLGGLGWLAGRRASPGATTVDKPIEPQLNLVG